MGGGDSTPVQKQLADIKHIYSTSRAFAAVKSQGSVVTWGDVDCGLVSHQNLQMQLVDIQRIYSTSLAFAAVKRDSTVVTWGYDGSGGNCSAVLEQLGGDWIYT